MRISHVVILFPSSFTNVIFLFVPTEGHISSFGLAFAYKDSV